VGRLIHQKGFDIAIRGFALIADRYPTARLILVGDGDQRESLENLAQQLRLEGRVDFLGLVAPARVHQLLADATLVVMPSRWEGLPVAAVEASMSGRPIIGTRVAGIPEVVIDGRTGLIIESESPQAIADGIVTLLDDPSLAIALGKAARVHALESFTMDRCVNSYDALYRQLGHHRRHTDFEI
jgi:glycosyltransferase involved in cell wall biosynthesis